MKQKGVFFSTDALIALTVLLIGIIIVYPFETVERADSYVQTDFIQALSSLTIGELNNSQVATYISSGQVQDTNKSVLEQIGEFYVINKTLAIELTNIIFDSINTTDNIGIWFGNELIASRNNTPFETARNVITDRQIISGIQEGESVTAYSARAFISNNLQSEYFYFGGYIGEGNITARIEYYGNISSATLEIATDEDFEVFVNNNSAGSFNGSTSVFTPQTYNIPTTDFSSGVNHVELRGEGFNIAGGFLKISYQKEITNQTNTRYYFPGIEGIINLYDGIYIPGNLTEMDITLHFNNSLTTFLNIGNVTVYNDSTNGDETIVLNNTFLSALLDYDSLSEKTTPLRFGIDNASYLANISKPVDVFSVTDLSGSMNLGNCANYSVHRWYCDYPAYSSYCPMSTWWGGCGGTWGGYSLLESAQDANKAFIDTILNSSKNRIGLVGYKDQFYTSDFHSLSTDNTSLKAEVDSWSAEDATCICCGINKATEELANFSNSSTFRSIVVMSDGVANVQCPQQNTGDAKGDAVMAACDAYNDHGIKVYSVGFGPSADETTLQSIALCGNGTYYYGNITNLVDIYKNIAGEIIEGAFFEQTLIFEGNFSSQLHPDSYIDLTYNDTQQPFGIVATAEKTFNDAYSGTFSLPENSSLVEAVVVSYSGPRWTSEAYINNIPYYNLSAYGSEYVTLGDPYSVHIPTALTSINNTLNITTGLSPANTSEGSEHNKIIYTVVRENVAAYSALSSSAQGCTWNIEFSTNTTTTSIPSNYTGNQTCYHTSAGQNISNTNDAMQVAVQRLLELLDFDSNGVIDVAFNEDDLEITSSAITGIPYSWSTEMQVRTWNT